MRRFDVGPAILKPFERSIAIRATVGSIGIFVQLLMPSEARLQTEAGRTLITFVVKLRILTVAVAVYFQSVASGECFVADSAAIALDAVVRFVVLLEMAGFLERSGTDRTWVASLLVDSLQVILTSAGHNRLYYFRQMVVIKSGIRNRTMLWKSSADEF